EAGRVKGQFVLTRQANVRSPELADTSLRGLTLEPNADNTLLLYDNQALGVRFLYPRRWRVGRIQGRQVALDEANGNGGLLTGEPTVAAFSTEIRAYLTKQGAKILRGDPPRRLHGPPEELDQFGLDVEMAGRHERLEYFVVRQPTGGATMAARLLANDVAA